MAKHLTLRFDVQLESPVVIGRPVSAHVSLTDILPKDLRGVVDEHSFTLEEITPSGAVDIPVQFSSDPHNRMPADTPPLRVTKTPPIGAYPRAHPTANHFSCETQSDLTASRGTFIWYLRPSAEKKRSFVLRFELAQDGEYMQYSYFPCNFVVFHGKRVSPMRQFPSVEVGPHISPDKKLNITIDQKLFATYNYGPERHKPYFYPVIGPSGVEVTTDGKQHDPADSHWHHHSLWIAHQSVGGVNYWEQWPDCGRIAHQGFDRLECGPVCANIAERNHWQRDGRVYAYEKRNFKVYKTGSDFIYMDVQISLAPETEGRFAGDLVIGKNIWGFLAARVKESMGPTDSGGEITNAWGGVGEEEVIWESAAWMDISGPATAGEWNGIAIFDHPSNASFPTRWQCRNDGFICSSFSCDRDFVVPMGETLTVNHRVFIHKGDAQRGNVGLAFDDYSTACTITHGDILPADR